MMPVWPAELPQRVSSDGYSYQHAEKRARTQTDSGSVRARRRLSFVPDLVRCRIELSDAQKKRFEAFLAADLDDGVRPFRFPGQPGPEVWIVQIGDTMPSWGTLGADWVLTLELARLG